jgi:type IV pilus assembly protein PilE
VLTPERIREYSFEDQLPDLNVGFMARLHSRNGQYSDVIGPPSVELEITRGNKVYAVVAERGVQTFTLTATPVETGMMAGDKCGGFVVDNLGRRGNVNAGATEEGCWGR